MQNASVQSERDLLVADLLPQALDLMRDAFGNYVIQNFLEFGTQNNHIALGMAMVGNVALLASETHGCRVLQRALDSLEPGLRNQLMLELIPLDSSDVYLHGLFRDEHSTHVLQKLVLLLQTRLEERVPKQALVFDAEQEQAQAHLHAAMLRVVQRAVASCLLELCNDQQACKLVRCVLHTCEPGLFEEMPDILELILNNLAILAINQYGNFILQHLLDHGTAVHKRKVRDFLKANLVDLSMHKFGSHLVEKCLTSSRDANDLVTMFLSPIDAASHTTTLLHMDGTALPLLMTDRFANFVVQKGFDVCTGQVKEDLLVAIQGHVEGLRGFTYGKHILSRTGLA